MSTTHEGLVPWKGLIPGLALLVTISTFLSMVPCGSAVSTTTVDGQMVLYLSAQGGLSVAPPPEPAPQEAAFTGAVGLVYRSVGTWRSGPLTSGLELSGGANASLWAKSDLGVAQRAKFRVTVYKNDDTTTGTALVTETKALSAQGSEFKADGSVTLSLAMGDTITVLVEEATTGGRGSFLFWGTPAPSAIVLGGVPCEVWVDMPIAQKGKLETHAEAWHAWGPSYIEDVSAYALGPFEERSFEMDFLAAIDSGQQVVASASMSEMDAQVSNTSLLLTWTWDHQSGDPKAKPGNYYIVFVATDASGQRYVGRGMGTVVRESNVFFESPIFQMGLFITVGGIAAAVYLFSVRTERLKVRNTRIAALAVTAIIIVAAGVGAFQAGSRLFSGKDEAPDFTVKDIGGGTFSLSGHRGSVIIIDLFATWCPSCNALMPELKQVSKDYPNVVIISIDVDKTETEAQVKAFKDKYGANWHFAMDTDELMNKYSVTYIPTMVIVNPQGYVSYTKVGEEPAKAIGVEVKKAYSGGVQEATAKVGDIRVLAFAVGMLSFFAPCAFPLLPGYFVYYLGRPVQRKEDELEGTSEDGKGKGTGTGDDEGGRGGAGDAGGGGSRVNAGPNRAEGLRPAMAGGLAAAFGIFLVFSSIGLLVAILGSGITRYILYMAPVMTVIIAIMGVILVLDIHLPIDSFASRLPMRGTFDKAMARVMGKEEDRGRFSGLFAYGAAYGLASMGCQAPVFIALILAAFFAGGFASALLVFVLFGLGMALMMVTVTVLVGKAKDKVIVRLRGLMPLMKRVSGAILIIAGIYLTWVYVSVL